MSKFKLYVFLYIPCILFSSNISHSLSYQGYTGLINTPNAQVMNEGDISLHFNNNYDNSLRSYNYDVEHSYEENYIFATGLFDFVEIQGRLTEVHGKEREYDNFIIRDLSANIKVQVPFYHTYLPNVAFGMQDLGGEANNFDNRYVVLDKGFDFFRISVGYGESTLENKSRKRMDGFFGGVEIEAYDWLHFIAEKDSYEENAGIRFYMPKFFEPSKYFKFDMSFSRNLSSKENSFGFNLTLPFYENKETYHRGSTNLHQQNYLQIQRKFNDLNKSMISSKIKNKTILQKEGEALRTLPELSEKLKDLQFENISVGYKKDTVYVAYENNTFLHNDVDAVGVVLGMLTKLADDYKKFIIEQKRSKVTSFVLNGNLSLAKDFYNDPSIKNKLLFSSSLKKTHKAYIEGFDMVVKDAQDTFLKPRIEFSPKIITLIGTEIGLLDYALFLRSKANVNLTKGLDFVVVYDKLVSTSENMDPDKGIARYYSQDSRLESVMLHYSSNFYGAVNTLSYGSMDSRYKGVSNQLIYNIGNSSFRLKGGYFKQFIYKDKVFSIEKQRVRKYGLLKYGYYFDQLDMFCEAQFGRYWKQDEGYDFTIKRFFGDMAVYLKYQYSESESDYDNIGGVDDHYAGIGVSFPITPRKTYVGKYGQLYGSKAFGYGVRTTIMSEDGRNTVVPGGAIDPYVSLDAQRYFFNRNRIHTDYFKNNLYRMVHVYSEYTK